MRLDKTYFVKQSFQQASEHHSVYRNMDDAQRAEAFLLLMQAAYGFVGQAWPKMDKHLFHSRKNGEKK